ncbi:MAG: SMP-30/gluconolactonase/LRE family protein [Novosphingobium sp.]
MEFRQLATGYTFLEAPRVQGDAVWFTDLLAGGVFRLNADGTTNSFLLDKHHIGGICLNHDGRLICGGNDAHYWLDPVTGESGVVLSEVHGGPHPGSNDMLPDDRGGLYWGTTSHGGNYGDGLEPELTKLMHLDSAGNVRVVSEGLSFANGVGISPDGGTLYHNESLRGCFAYDIATDGSLSNRRMFAPQEDCDGLAVDVDGGVWIACCFTAQVVRYRPDGTLDYAVPVPDCNVTSICFGGPDWRDVYVTTGGDDGIEIMMQGKLPLPNGRLFHAKSDIPGLPVPETRFDLA